MNLSTVREGLPSHFHFLAVETGVLLNYQEFKCLEMALYFLTEQYHSKHPQCEFINLRICDLRHLNQWLNQAKLKQQLCKDNHNEVACPIDADTDLNWLMLALELGMNEKIINRLALDEANYLQDMEMQYAKTDEDYQEAHAAFCFHYQEFWHYYHDIAQQSQQVLAKFREVLKY